MADQYAREAARVAALQLADSVGFDVAQQSCIEILADLLLRYIQEAGAGSHHYAELAGRSETNAVDVALSLNDLGTGIAALRDFVRQSLEVPFEPNISAFPLRKKSRPPPTFLDKGEVPPPHIPPWLPALPDRHTYVATAVFPQHEKDPQQRQMKLTEQRQQAETAVVKLQARLAADSNQLLVAKLAPPVVSADGEVPAPPQQQQGPTAGAGAPSNQQTGAAAAGALKSAGTSNPFFAAPWGDLAPEAGFQQPQPAAAEAVGAAGGRTTQQPGAAMAAGSNPGEKVEWEAAAWEPASSTAGGGSGFVAQQLFASRDWKAQQQRKARIATSGRVVREAFGEAYEEQAAARQGKRQKRTQRPDGGVVVAVNDPTRSRVETILAATAQAVAPPAAPLPVQEDEELI